jgi:DNA-binding GntR family transcriptional regulator
MSTPRMAWTIRDATAILIFQMPVPADKAALERDLLRDRAYTTIRDAIVDGTLQPGERLRDQELTEWLGLSRTPIREALSRLEQDGLVETEPQRFTRVAPLDRRAARDAFPLVAALHALAAELALPDPNRLRKHNEAFAAALDARDVDAAIAADDAFHAEFVHAARNAELERALDRLMPGVRRLERLRFASLAGRDSVAQHDAIVEAVEAQDVTTTSERVRENWRSLGTLIDRSFE